MSLQLKKIKSMKNAIVLLAMIMMAVSCGPEETTDAVFTKYNVTFGNTKYFKSNS